MTTPTTDCVFRLIRVIALALFAIWGITYLAPQVAERISSHLQRAITIEGKVGL